MTILSSMMGACEKGIKKLSAGNHNASSPSSSSSRTAASSGGCSEGVAADFMQALPDQTSKANGHEVNLKERADARNLNVGCAISSHLLKYHTYRTLVAENFNTVVSEYEMKWKEIHPGRNKYNFEGPDKIIEFAEKNHIRVRGHTLLWHLCNPRWLIEDIEVAESEQVVLDIMRSHIHTVVGRYKGKIMCWDVVNEAIGDDGKNSLRKSIWFKALGEKYIEYAFRFAHEADPDALLFYNDYYCECAEWAKTGAVYRLVKSLKDKGVPIHGVGLQNHFEGYPQTSKILETVKRMKQIGLRVHLTELDIRVKLPVDEQKTKRQVGSFRRAAEVCKMSEGVCDTLVVWGVSDKHSWIGNQYKGYGSALLFNEDYQKKPSYYALANAL
eukprot:Nk52_evm7s2039 gene=Nk52_evmTU7s2039